MKKPGKIDADIQSVWKPGSAPVAVVLISLNEEHNLAAVLENVSGWAQEVFLVDSFSCDKTIDIALSFGINVVQRPFKGFGDQWDYAVTQLPISAPWTMKLDPDERLTDELKLSINEAIRDNSGDALVLSRRLWFMGKPLPVHQKILRLWRTGTCRFSEVKVNEHPLVEGTQYLLSGDLEHHDSPNLFHWYEKQNRYTTAEALAAYHGDSLSVVPKLFGAKLERRMWIKRVYTRIPFRHQLMMLYCLFWLSAWRAGRAGFIWSRLRAEVYRMREYKRQEMVWQGKGDELPPGRIGNPDPRVTQS